MSRQIIYMTGAILVFAILGRVISFPQGMDDWPIIELSDTSHVLVMERHPHALFATLTNKNPTEEISVGARFVLAKLDENGDWREFPFREDLIFESALTTLPYGYSARFTLSEDMLGANLTRGIYRIVVDVWQDTHMHAWAEFELD
ncbi:MAG: hypothetical protein FWF78_07380 [Defluviitaleaceae bacterium]|nr:hypothetical protein [Defluviitaleaceae bacterium]